MIQNILQGFMSLCDFKLILMILFGTLFGLIIGALPGLTGNMAIALMVPITFVMKPTEGLALLSAIYCSSIYGGSISAILLNIPGTVSSFCTTFDGYPLAKKGRAGEALGISTLSSAFGGLFSTLVLMFFTPFLAEQALKFGPGEYFAIAILGLSCIAGLGDSPKKGLLSGALGLLLGMIGMDPQSGRPRFTFGSVELMNGIGLVPSLIGIFGVIAVLKTAERAKQISQVGTMPSVGSVWIGWKNCKKLLPTWLRGSILGTIVGIIPGTGTNVATFMSYDLEKKLSKHSDEFGHGAPEGVAAPESSNNAVTGGSMVPLIALGIPGNATSALFLGAIMIHGFQTGPVFMTEHADVVYSLFAAFFVANLVMIPLGMLVMRGAKMILSVPENLLGGIILVLCATGVYSLRGDAFDVLIMIIFGIIGYAFYKFKIPTAPLIVAMVLESLTESSFRQALVASNGSCAFMWTSPLTCVILILSVISLFSPLIMRVFRLAKRRKAGA